MWQKIEALPKDEAMHIIVQTTEDVYQCVWANNKINWPGRADYSAPEPPLRWTEDPSA